MQQSAQASDMSRTDWRALLRGLFKFLAEEAAEPEHAEDATLATTANSAIPAAGIMHVDPARHVLFVKRGGSSDHPGSWCFPGGGIEDGETPVACAAREDREETGHDCAGDALREIDRRELDGVDFTTYLRECERFEPALDGEHTEFVWAPWGEWPEPLHPGVSATVEKLSAAERAEGCIPRSEMVALDRASVRSYDADGRLHVAASNISKACVNPYWGREIPDCRELGLDPNKQYRLLRHPDELAKAADTFNNLPVLSRHVPVSADSHQPYLVIGSTGTDAAFRKPYLTNSLVIWAKPAIDAIESNEQRQLSCAYRYAADMTPGVYEGESYDGVMCDIVGNHVALVRDGRAGPEVMVGDEKPTLWRDMRWDANSPPTKLWAVRRFD